MARRGRRRKLFKLRLKSDVVANLFGLLFLVLSLIFFLAYIKPSGSLLQLLSNAVFTFFGPAQWLLSGALLVSGLMLLRLKKLTIYLNHVVGMWLFFLSFDILFKYGRAGQLMRQWLINQLGDLVVVLIFSLGLVTAVMLILDMSLSELLSIVTKFIDRVCRPVFNLIYGLIKKVVSLRHLFSGWFKSRPKAKPKITPVKPETKSDYQPPPPPQTQPRKTNKDGKLIKGAAKIPWQSPDISLISLTKKKPADRGNIKENSKLIEKTLSSFGIKAKVVRTNEGSAVTQYALEVSAGTKLSKIISLQNDLALALAAPQGRIRIEAPIPGESLVGIEVPNRNLELVPTSEVVSSSVFRTSPSKLTFALGKDVSGKIQVADLTKMPHLLVAGATNSGKSVFLNNLIVSLLYKASPTELKMILVDPKRVELSLFKDLPYLITPVIKEADKVLSALNWAVNQMQARYKKLSEVGVRNIKEYHKLLGFAEMPYLVIIIDELAQIMLFSPNEVEKAITQLAQLARAVGIHLVLATQRPSVDIITGLIKANIPARISFYVTSGVDSKVILDTTGAEKLLGQGDMLYQAPDKATPQRLQGAYISTAEVRNVTDYIRNKYANLLDYHEEVTTAYLSSKDGKSSLSDNQITPELRQAITAAISYGEISISLLQRRLQIGYNKAARLVEQMEARGWVAPAESGQKRRKVLINSVDQIDSVNN